MTQIKRISVGACAHAYVLSAASVAQSCTLSVSVPVVAGRDDLAERGSVSRSTLIAAHALDLSKRWTAGKGPAGHRHALLWLRLRRAGPYRGFVFRRLRQAPPRPVSPTVCRLQVGDSARFSRLEICATTTQTHQTDTYASWVRAKTSVEVLHSVCIRVIRVIRGQTRSDREKVRTILPHGKPP